MNSSSSKYFRTNIYYRFHNEFTHPQHNYETIDINWSYPQLNNLNYIDSQKPPNYNVFRQCNTWAYPHDTLLNAGSNKLVFQIPPLIKMSRCSSVKRCANIFMMAFEKLNRRECWFKHIKLTRPHTACEMQLHTITFIFWKPLGTSLSALMSENNLTQLAVKNETLT